MWIFWHVWDVFSVLSDWINLIPFYERKASQDTRLEYQQQGNWSNLKIYFLHSGLHNLLISSQYFQNLNFYLYSGVDTNCGYQGDFQLHKNCINTPLF